MQFKHIIDGTLPEEDILLIDNKLGNFLSKEYAEINIQISDLS